MIRHGKAVVCGGCQLGAARDRTVHSIIRHFDNMVGRNTGRKGRGIEDGGYEGETASGPVLALAAVEEWEAGRRA